MVRLIKAGINGYRAISNSHGSGFTVSIVNHHITRVIKDDKTTKALKVGVTIEKASAVKF